MKTSASMKILQRSSGKGNRANMTAILILNTRRVIRINTGENILGYDRILKKIATILNTEHIHFSPCRNAFCYGAGDGYGNRTWKKIRFLTVCFIL